MNKYQHEARNHRRAGISAMEECKNLLASEKVDGDEDDGLTLADCSHVLIDYRRSAKDKAIAVAAIKEIIKADPACATTAYKVLIHYWETQNTYQSCALLATISCRRTYPKICIRAEAALERLAAKDSIYACYVLPVIVYASRCKIHERIPDVSQNEYMLRAVRQLERVFSGKLNNSDYFLYSIGRHEAEFIQLRRDYIVAGDEEEYKKLSLKRRDYSLYHCNKKELDILLAKYMRALEFAMAKKYVAEHASVIEAEAEGKVPVARDGSGLTPTASPRLPAFIVPGSSSSEVSVSSAPTSPDFSPQLDVSATQFEYKETWSPLPKGYRSGRGASPRYGSFFGETGGHASSADKRPTSSLGAAHLFLPACRLSSQQSPLVPSAPRLSDPPTATPVKFPKISSSSVSE
ncbi:hypothetical protein BH10PSE19_BH10PSE19_10990 [soil metagenome]